MKVTPAEWLVPIALLLTISDSCLAGERIRRLKNKENGSSDNGVLLFSQIKTDKRDLLWGFEVGKPGEKRRYLAGREMRFPNAFYDIGCGRMGSVTAISLSPGIYELGPWKIDSGMVLIGPIWSFGKNHKGPKNRFTIEIRSGEISYAGEISIDEAQGNAASIKDNLVCDKVYVENTWPWMVPLPATRAESIPID